MDLKITGIRYENIREFKEVELDFTNESSDNPHHISLVQMPNGTGKTTTMNLIRILLLGKDIDQEKVRSFQPSGFDATEGAFEADFVSSSGPFTLRLELDYQVGDHSYRHIIPQEVGGGDRAGHFLPTELNNVTTEDFVDLFVFNGELTEEFIETGSNEAENALKIVNFLDRLENQKNQIEQVVQERQENANVTTEKGYHNIQTRLQTTKQKLEELQNKRDRLEKEIDRHNQKVNELEKRRKGILAENEQQLEEDKRLERKIQRLKDELKSKTQDLLDTMRKPSRLDKGLNEDMEKLLKNMDIMQLPKSTSQEFFTELSEGDSCICGRAINEEHEEIILNNAEKYLTEQDIGVLNSLKDNLRNIPDYENFDDTLKKLQNKREELKQAEQERARLDLDDPNLNDKLEGIIKQIDAEERKRNDKQDELRRLKTNDKIEHQESGLYWKNNIPLCKRKREQWKKQLRQASGTVNFGKKADLLEDIFNDFIDRYLKSLKNKQIEDTNEKLERILGLSKVQVEDIDSSIKIEGRDDISEGQALSIAYAYLSTLFEDSALDVPFVIDSPAVSIDYEKRAEVAPIISNLFDQLIIFIISPERKSFVDELKSNDIQYCTIHKTGTPGKIEKHLNKDFFMEFQSEEERQEAA